MTFGPLEASHSSLMHGFLLERRRWRLVSFILAALCAKVGMPSPQKFVGELAHSVTQELGGNSRHSLMCFVHNLSTMPDKKASVKSYNFSSKLKLVWHIYREYLELCLTSDSKRGNFHQDFIHFGFKIFLRDRVERLEIEDLAQILEVASQWDCRNHSFVSQVNLGQDLLKLLVNHSRSN